MPIIETEQQTNQNVISGQEYLDAGATKELVGQLRGYAEGYNDGYDAGVTAGGSSGSQLRLYQFRVLRSGALPGTYFYWCPSQEPEVGDIIAGSEYEGMSLDTRYPVLAIKTVAELKASNSSWVNFFNNNANQGFNDTSKCYQYDSDNDGYFILATDIPSFTPSEYSPAYIDFSN